MYGLYARKDIVHPDGATGVIYKAGERVATLTTDENGEASVENLYLGEVFCQRRSRLPWGIWQMRVNMILCAAMKEI